MTDNSKTTRIFTLLSEAKEEGVKEVELFDDFEEAGYVRVLKHRLNKALGRNAIVIKNGVWYLDEEYWSMTKYEFRDFMNRFELREMAERNNYTMITMGTIFAIVVIFTSVFIYIISQPSSFEECISSFDLELKDIIEE